MKRAILMYGIGQCLVMGFLGLPVSAADSPSPTAACVNIDKLKADIKGAKFTQLNPGQFHYMEGVFSGTAPVGPPPNADAAWLVQMKKKNFVIWMAGSPSCVIRSNPVTPIPEQMVGVIRSINPSPGETTADGWSDDSKDLHL